MLNYILQLDGVVEQYINSISSPLFTVLFRLITEFGSVVFTGIVVLALLYFLWSRDKKLVRYFITAVLANEAVVYLLKHLIGRLRPFGALRYYEFDASMPSGHAAISMLVYGFVCYLIVRYCPRCGWKNVAFVLSAGLVVLVGFSRLYLDVHYLSDVLAGYLVGGVTLGYLIVTAEKRVRK